MGKNKPKMKTMSLSEFAGDTPAISQDALPTAPREDRCAPSPELAQTQHQRTERGCGQAVGWCKRGVSVAARSVPLRSAWQP
eukprot:4074053-Prymnesium_polylepis.1